MPTNEDGEFELILGNRQLLSVFFIVVILLGVFFTMGYIVGRNSTPVAIADAGKTDTKPLVVESPAPRTPEAPVAEPATKAREPVSPAPISTAQQQPPDSPKETKSEVRASPSKSEPVKSEPVKAAKVEKAAKAVPAPVSSGSLSGTYLQLAATTKREADIMVDVLRQKKFGAVTAQVPEKPDLFRVLVGPMTEAQVNKIKTDLQSAGFPGDKSIKRTY